MKIFLAFSAKEFTQIFRDRRTLAILFLLPLILVMLFGFAITNDIKDARVAVLDCAKDKMSQGIIERLRSSEYFEIYESLSSISEANEILKRGKVKAVLIFPENLAARATHDGSAQIKAILDASDPNESASLGAYIEAIVAQECSEKSGAGREIRQVIVKVNMLYNPQLKSAYNFVPGVMGLILFLICTLMTSVGIVREKEMGNMEILLVSPVRPIYIVVAKAAPYFVISIAIVCAAIFLANFALGVPIRGSIFLLFAVSAIYTLLALVVGIMVSTFSNTQQTAMFVSSSVFMLPTVLLSGMVFPVENMPKILQWFSAVVPAKWYISALRDIMLKGAGLELIAQNIIVMTLMIFVFSAFSILKFKIRLE